MNVISDPSYGVLMLIGIVISAWMWQRRAKTDPLLVVVYVFGLLGALLGAKVGYLVAELPFRAGDPHFWLHALVGRTILGGLLGGYVGVEIGKRLIGHTAPTGDMFAVIVPVALVFGRIGCYLHGCCLGKQCSAAWYAMVDQTGVPRWPASPVEAGFNLIMAIVLGVLINRQRLRGQLFHVYLMAYGLFRFGHEFLRETPRPGNGIFSTYQAIALILFAFGLWQFNTRQKEQIINLANHPLARRCADETPQ